MDRQQALERLQQEELDILCMIDGFCAQHGIQWFLVSGTALGALRHQGFIPWDDDIDIGMLREDYDRFVELAETGLPTGYSLHTWSNTRGFAGMFAKVYRDGTVFQTAETREAGCPQAIFVDVFPYDRVSEDSRVRARQVRNAMIWQRLSYLYHSGTITVPHRGVLGAIERFGCRCLHHLVRPFLTPELIARNFERSVVWGRDGGDEKGTHCYLSLSAPYVEPVAKEVLVPTVQATFEGNRLPVPGHCETYLETWYGDWRTLPDAEHRRTHLPEKIIFSDGSRWTGRAS